MQKEDRQLESECKQMRVSAQWRIGIKWLLIEKCSFTC